MRKKEWHVVEFEMCKLADNNTGLQGFAHRRTRLISNIELAADSKNYQKKKKKSEKNGYNFGPLNGHFPIENRYHLPAGT